MKVTIRCERADGQFTVAETEVPDDPPVNDYARTELTEKIALGFIDAYRRCSELLPR